MKNKNFLLFPEAPGLRVLSLKDWVKSLMLFSREVKPVLRSTLFGRDFVLPFNAGRSALCFWLNFIGRTKGVKFVILSPRTCEAVLVAVRNAGLFPIQVSELPSGDIDQRNLHYLIQKYKDCVAVVRQNTLGFDEWKHVSNDLLAEQVPTLDDNCLALQASPPFGNTPSIFSLELSKILSVGWGGALRISPEDPNLDAILQAYSEIGSEPSCSRLRKFFQAFVYWVLERHDPRFASKIKTIFFKLKIFNYSSCDDDRTVFSDFVKKLPPERIVLANQGFKKIEPLIESADRTNIYARLKSLGRRNGLEWRAPEKGIIVPRLLLRIDRTKIDVPDWFFDASWFNQSFDCKKCFDPDNGIVNLPHPLVMYKEELEHINLLLSYLEKVSCVE